MTIKKSFSLVEVVLTLVIIGLLIGFVVPRNAGRIAQGQNLQIETIRQTYQSKIQAYQDRARYELDKQFDISNSYDTTATVIFDSSTLSITSIDANPVPTSCEIMLRVFGNVSNESLPSYTSVQESTNGCRYTYVKSGEYFIYDNTTVTVGQVQS